MGSSGTGWIVTEFSPAKVTSTLAPGRRPIFCRSDAGITTCPLADVSTTGMDVNLQTGMLNGIG
jgi:hypothetical protein